MKSILIFFPVLFLLVAQIGADSTKTEVLMIQDSTSMHAQSLKDTTKASILSDNTWLVEHVWGIFATILATVVGGLILWWLTRQFSLREKNRELSRQVEEFRLKITELESRNEKIAGKNSLVEKRLTELNKEIEEARKEKGKFFAEMIEIVGDKIEQEEKITDLMSVLRRIKEKLQQAERKSEWIDKEPENWLPQRNSRFTWDKAKESGFLYPLDVCYDLPYIVSFRIEPKTQDLWRAGLVFFDRDLLDPQLLVNWEKNPDGQYYHDHFGYPITEGANLKDRVKRKIYDEQQMCEILVMVSTDRAFAKFDRETSGYVHRTLQFSPSNLKNPHLIAWCEEGICDVAFRDIVIRPATKWDEKYLDNLLDQTLHKHSLKTISNDLETKQAQSVELSDSALRAVNLIRKHFRKEQGKPNSKMLTRDSFLRPPLINGEQFTIDVDIALAFLTARGEVIAKSRGPGELPVYRPNPDFNPKEMK